MLIGRVSLWHRSRSDVNWKSCSTEQYLMFGIEGIMPGNSHRLTVYMYSERLKWCVDLLTYWPNGLTTLVRSPLFFLHFFRSSLTSTVSLFEFFFSSLFCGRWHWNFTTLTLKEKNVIPKKMCAHIIVCLCCRCYPLCGLATAEPR